MEDCIFGSLLTDTDILKEDGCVVPYFYVFLYIYI